MEESPLLRRLLRACCGCLGLGLLEPRHDPNRDIPRDQEYPTGGDQDIPPSDDGGKVSLSLSLPPSLMHGPWFAAIV